MKTLDYKGHTATLETNNSRYTFECYNCNEQIKQNSLYVNFINQSLNEFDFCDNLCFQNYIDTISTLNLGV